MAEDFESTKRIGLAVDAITRALETVEGLTHEERRTALLALATHSTITSILKRVTGKSKQPIPRNNREG